MTRIEIATPNFTGPISDRLAIWTLGDGTRIRLLTPEQLRDLPDGTELRCIDGAPAVVGRDPIDDDTRYGRLAYGLPE